MMKRYILLRYVRQGSCWWKIEVPPFEVNWHFNKKAVCTNPSSYWLWRWQNILLVSISTILCCKVEMSRSTACWAKNSRQFHQQKYPWLYKYRQLEVIPNFYAVYSTPVVLNLRTTAAHQRWIWKFWRPTIHILKFFGIFNTFNWAKMDLFGCFSMYLLLIIVELLILSKIRKVLWPTKKSLRPTGWETLI